VYPVDLTDELERVLCEVAVPYVDLSLQHVSRPLLRRMRRWGDGGRFLERIESIRSRRSDAAFRSNFIVGYPGETEDDHDALLAFVDEAQLDWCGFFAYSEEAGTYSAGLDEKVAAGLVAERLLELRARQDEIIAARRDQLIGSRVGALVDAPGIARSHREAPEIDGIIEVPTDLTVGSFVDLVVTGAAGPDLVAVPA
jgi:ribosomal protein S12 methylthiotransferase